MCRVILPVCRNALAFSNPPNLTALPSPSPRRCPPSHPPPPRDSCPATLHDLHLLAAASAAPSAGPSAAPSDSASWAGDGTSLTDSSGRRRTSSGHGSAWRSGALLHEEPPLFWQHCLLVGLYNVCLDDDACQEVCGHGHCGAIMVPPPEVHAV